MSVQRTAWPVRTTDSLACPYPGPFLQETLMAQGHKTRFLRHAATLLAGAVGALALGASAQAAYPEKPVHIVVGFSAGGTTDVIARIMAKELTQELGQSFVVENKPGAGSNIATDYVRRAAPDG